MSPSSTTADVDTGEAGAVLPGSLDGKNLEYPRFWTQQMASKPEKNNLQASGLGVLLTADGGRYEGKLFGAEGIGEGDWYSLLG